MIRRSWCQHFEFQLIALLIAILDVGGASAPACAQQEILQVFGNTILGGASPGFGEAAASGDFDGDGHLDLAVGASTFGASNEGAVFVLLGPFSTGTPANGTISMYNQWLPYVPSRLGIAVAMAPSFRFQSLSLPGLPATFAGVQGISAGRVLEAHMESGATTSWIVPDPYEGEVFSFGQYITVCDFNNDTFDDVMVRTGNATGQVSLYLGGDGADGVVDVIIKPQFASSSFGKTLCGVADVSGDVYDDLIIGDNFNNRVYVVFGRTVNPRLPGQDPIYLVLTGASDEQLVNTVQFARIRSAAGGVDLTGNGTPDLVFANEQTGDVMVFEGPIGEDGFPAARTTFNGTTTFGSSLAVGGDVDGDGYHDLLIADKSHATSVQQNTGRVTVALGGPRMAATTIPCGDELTTRNVWQLQPAWLHDDAHFGTSIGFLGDQVGVGDKDEIFAGAPGMLDGGGVVAGKVSGFNLSASAIEIADSALPIPTGPSCTGPRVFAVQIDVPQDVTLASVVANSVTLGLSDTPLTDLDGDGIYTAILAGIFVPPSGATVEVFANATTVSGGFAVKDVHVPASPSPLVAPSAEYPLSKSSPALPLLAVRVSPCGGAPTRVTMDDPTVFYWNQLELTDQGPPSDLIANDGIWSYSGSEAAIILPPPGFYNFDCVAYYDGGTIIPSTVKVQVIEPTAVSYVNKSSGTGLDYAGQPYSSVTIDFTQGPGPKDLFISMLADRGMLYTCTNVSLVGVPEFSQGSLIDTGGAYPPAGLLGMTVADFNNDGREDLFAASQTSARLYQAASSGNSVLQDVTSALIPAGSFANSLTGAWGDYDRDGRLDLFVGRGIVTGEPGVDSGTPAIGVLLRNDTRSGAGFVDVSASTGIGDLGQYATTATWGDINGDKFPDLFVGDASESGTASRLFRNDKDGGFVDEASTRFNGNLNSVVGAGFGDVDADGDLDLTVATRTGVEIRRNTNSGTYTSVVPVGTASSVSGLNVFDFDCNGVQDVLLLSADTAATPKLFKGASSSGNLSFSDVTSAVGLNWPGKIGGSVLSDFNSDGDLDLYLGRAVAQGAYFFTAAGLDPTTDAYTQNWLRVTLTSNLGVPNNYKGIGAKVTATQGANQFVRVVDGGSGRGGQDDSVLIFGLPSSAPVDLVSVAWPNGYVQSISGPISVGTVLTVVDDTQAFSVTQAMGGYEIIPCEGVNRWNFTWKTSVGTNPALDRIVYKSNDADLQNGGTTVSATDAGVSHLCSVSAAGAYVHSISFVVPCDAGRVVYFAATSAAVTETTSQTRSFAESICSVCDPNQQ